MSSPLEHKTIFFSEFCLGDLMLYVASRAVPSPAEPSRASRAVPSPAEPSRRQQSRPVASRAVPSPAEPSRRQQSRPVASRAVPRQQSRPVQPSRSAQRRGEGRKRRQPRSWKPLALFIYAPVTYVYTLSFFSFKTIISKMLRCRVPHS